MKVININKLDISKLSGNRVVALGLFESMHKGHIQIINKCAATAREHKLLSTVVTISEPVNKAGTAIFDINHRIEKIRDLNIDELIVIEMSEEVRRSSSNQFIDFLRNINTQIIITGLDYRFGYKGSGDVNLLSQTFEVMAQKFTMSDNQKISTTQIKEYLLAGNIKHANMLLGYNYYIKGIVKKGKQIGRTIGFPTANIYPENGCVATGVYLTRTTISGNHYRSITNVGYNPTLGDNRLSIETYIGDGFNQEIYEQEIKVEMIDRIRDEVKFGSVDELVARLTIDIKYMEEVNYEGC